MNYIPDWGIVSKAMPLLLSGMRTSIVLTLLVVCIGLSLGIPVALARMSGIYIIRYLAQAYIEIFRCTPLLLQLFWVFYALPMVFGIKLPGFLAAVLTIGLNLIAYMAEAYRSGFQSIPEEQIEAANVLQLSRFDQVIHIIFPQAFRQQLPSILSLLVGAFKDTVLVSTIGVADLMFQANTASQQYYRPFEIFTVTALFYFIIAFPVTLVVNALERHMLMQRDNV
ncbi:amino acid ABC transporter permease [Bifidobacterium aquikefiri]|uniref:Polar amino acid ABC transporter, inner membrane subunit n=2 Tax=Bifidobacterium aquikefiri TaxID=1653207 RepID=A0A261G8X8_9BIFI|nr:polar amino acid ABC transporter, inner membrane subunit [Bifidobacterium aquikefiri]